jgi:hypothetical protein
MTTAFRLGLPTDIPWTRICVTEDMMDRVVCDDRLPPKWQSSVAVYRYVPDEEYQLYPDYDVSYLKVTATIGGYQALEDEIQGEIDWDGVNTTVVDSIGELLKSYFPCTGAIVQVVVGPRRFADTDPRLDEYPFFLDFEPKKRELYEMATDTREKQSRSSDTLQVTKSAGTAQSQEILDVDMGGSTSFGMSGQGSGPAGGGGGSLNVSSSNQGQWGTKSLNTQQSQTNRTREVGQELRESYSFTTQLSQMYHLLDSYHPGTNRAVFFVQPRPHVLEVPTGFVRGPRPVEGIQEFFLVVAKPKETPEYCVSVRLDTSHLAETDVLTYEEKPDITDTATAFARIPTNTDAPAPDDGTAKWTACAGLCWGVRYRAYMTSAADDVTYVAPAGFSITGFTDLVNTTNGHGSSSVTIAPGNKTLTVHAEAQGHIAIEAGWDVCSDCPDELEKWDGRAARQVQVNLRSDVPTKKSGTQMQLLLTTRGLCCCDVGNGFNKGVIGVVDVPRDLTVQAAASREGGGEVSTGVSADPAGTTEGGTGANPAFGPQASPMCTDCSGGRAAAIAPPPTFSTPSPPGMTIRQANAIADFARVRMISARVGPDAAAEPVPFVYTDAFVRHVTQFASRSRRGREMLDAPATEVIPGDLADGLAERLGKAPEELTARDVLSFRGKDLARMTSAGVEALARARLALAGVALKGGDGEGNGAESA